MHYASPCPTGLKPTLRQLMIVILWVALLLTFMRAMYGWGLFGNKPEEVCMNVGWFTISFPMPLLGLLLLGLDRRGPVRGWYLTCCGAGWSVLTGASFLCMDLVCFALCGRPTVVFPLFPSTAMIVLWGAAMQSRAAWPRRCPCCGCQATIATWERPRISSPGGRKMAQGWCAICGAVWEREGLMAWLPKADGGHGLYSSDVQ